MKSIQDYCNALGIQSSTLLSARRLESRVHRISKDISSARHAISSLQSKINTQHELISRLQGELDLITEFTAQKEVILKNLGPSLHEVAEQTKERIEMNLQSSGDQPWSKEDLDWIDSLMSTPEFTGGLDTPYSETLKVMQELSTAPTYEFDGSMVLPAPASPDLRMKNCQRLTLKNPGPNGGTVTFSKKMSS